MDLDIDYEARKALSLAPIDAYTRLSELARLATNEDSAWWCRWWASDCLVLLGDYARAANEYPRPTLGGRASFQTERLLSLKLAAGLPIAGIDVLTLLGPRVTAFGRKNLAQVSEAVDAIVEGILEHENRRLLEAWAQDAPRSRYQVFVGSWAGYEASKNVTLERFAFRAVPECTEFCAATARTAENMVRLEAGVPNVGEGWVSETALYHELRTAFPGEDVRQHDSPRWLGRQHLDIYFPDRMVGVEYQGLQHDEPVAYFGGEEAYLDQQRRDRRKRSLCRRHGVQLIYVRPGYDLNEVVTEIDTRSVT